MSAKRPTATIEDYLGILLVMERDQEKVKGARIAELLGVSPPTVNVTLKRMQRDGWLQSSEDKYIELTEKGRTAARSLMRRHLLTEWLLSETLNIPWANLHEEAHEIEHALSPMVEKQLIEKLKDKPTCPHGNPLPGREAFAANWKKLDEFAAGEKVIVRRVHEFGEEDLEMLLFLEKNHIIPGEKIEIIEVLPFNQTITVKARGKEVSLGSSVTEFLYVEEN